MSHTHTEADDSVTDVIEAARLVGLDNEQIGAAVANLLDADSSSHPPRDGLHAYMTGSGDGSSHTAVETLRDLLSHSALGIEANAKYWNDMPVQHMDETLGHHGCDVSITDSTGEPISVLLDESDMSMTITVTDTRRELDITTRFEYPDTELRTNNYPALVHTVNTDILAPLGLEYAQLSSEPTEWRFFLFDSDRLQFLRQTYGERIALPWFREPLLARTDFEDYFSNPIPTAHSEEALQEQEDTDGLGEALLTDEEPDAPEPDPVTAAPIDEPEPENTMTGGVLDLNAINDASQQQENNQSVSLDKDVESVITQAESMLEDEDIDEKIFGSGDEETDTDDTERSGAVDEEEETQPDQELESSDGEKDIQKSEDQPGDGHEDGSSDTDESTKPDGAVSRLFDTLRGFFG